VELESENYAEATGSIRVSNRGVGTLNGTVSSQVPWLACEPGEFECATGAAAQIEVHANVEYLLAHQRTPGTLEAADALLIESNAGIQEIDARLTLVLTPRLHVSPGSLQFEGGTEGTFQLENRGYGTLRVHLTPSEPWIAVNRREWTIKARKRARVRVRLLDAPERGQGNIEIRTPETVTFVPVLGASDHASDPA
jgi:hypothetical protein